jgi:hypothetical protein
VWIALSALCGALVTLAVPSASGTSAAGASVLAVGALALLAGHTWGLLVSVPSHVTLVGQLWPTFLPTHAGPPPVAAAVVLVTALPALALTAIVLPQIANHLLHDRPQRMRHAFVAASALALAASLVAPAVLT